MFLTLFLTLVSSLRYLGHEHVFHLLPATGIRIHCQEAQWTIQKSWYMTEECQCNCSIGHKLNRWFKICAIAGWIKLDALLIQWANTNIPSFSPTSNILFIRPVILFATLQSEILDQPFYTSIKSPKQSRMNLTCHHSTAPLSFLSWMHPLRSIASIGTYSRGSLVFFVSINLEQ